MTIQEMKELALHAVERTAPAEFSVDNVDEALHDAFAELAGSINNFRRNKYDIFDIMITAAEKVVPQDVLAQLGSFCEIRQVAQGQTVLFKRGPIGRNRAKKFLTQVGLSGVYETFKLDSETFRIPMKSIGGAITMDYERFLDGAENLSDLMEVMAEAQTQGIYREVQAALIAAASEARMPSANKVSASSFDAQKMVQLCNVVKSYGDGCTIFATTEFIDEMGPDYFMVAGTKGGSTITKAEIVKDDIDRIHNVGRIALFRGVPVVEMKQGFYDDSNTVKVLNPQYAYVLPTGKEKVVKVVLEGSTQMRDWENKDGSIEIESYRKVGVGIVHFNNWGIYQNTGITVTSPFSLLDNTAGPLGIGISDTDHSYPHWN